MSEIVGLDIELVTAGLARHVAMFGSAAVSSYTMLDGTVVPGGELSGDLGREIGGCAIQSRCTAAWEAIVELLIFLDAEHPEYFGRLMRACVRLSNGAREPDGCHNLLEDADQDMFDLEMDREARRDTAVEWTGQRAETARPRSNTVARPGRARGHRDAGRAGLGGTRCSHRRMSRAARRRRRDPTRFPGFNAVSIGRLRPVCPRRRYRASIDRPRA